MKFNRITKPLCPILKFERHDGLALFAQAGDTERDHVALLQEGRRLHAHANARWCASANDITGLERHELADVADDLGGTENHGLGRTGLHALAVDL